MVEKVIKEEIKVVETIEVEKIGLNVKFATSLVVKLHTAIIDSIPLISLINKINIINSINLLLLYNFSLYLPGCLNFINLNRELTFLCSHGRIPMPIRLLLLCLLLSLLWPT